MSSQARAPAQTQAPSAVETATSTAKAAADGALALGNAFVQSLMGSGTESGDQSHDAEAQAAETAQAETRPTEPVTPEPRVVEGTGGYVYKQYPDGLIRILEGPHGAGHTVPVGTPINDAITQEIGSFPLPESASDDVRAAAGPPVAATGAPAGPEVGRLFGMIAGTLATGANMARDKAGDVLDAAASAQDLATGAADAAKGAANAAWEWWYGEDESVEAAPGAGPSEAPEEVPAEAEAPEEAAPQVDIPEGHHQDRGTFVAPPVEETSTTSGLINQLYPYFPERDIVVGGFLDNSQQAWKVNFHWEYMRDMIDEAMGLGADDELTAVKSALDAVPPSGTGYRGDARAGDTPDTSTPEQIKTRWSTVNAQKKVLDPIFTRVAPWANGSRYSEKDFRLATARVAEPGTSNHGTGKALDIRGDNAEISRISAALGASDVYDEASHVHVEFLRSVNTGGKTPGDV
jgi:hypothetical protein